MKLRWLALLGLMTGLASAPIPLWSLTQMVAVQIEVAQPSLSPAGLDRAKVLAVDLEDAFMDRLFEAGHITFNAPSEILLAKGKTVPTSVENLLVMTKAGGASLLVHCRLAVSEPIPNQALVIGKVSVSAIPVYLAADFPVTWTLPLGKDTSDADFRSGLQRIAGLLAARLDDLPPALASAGR